MFKVEHRATVARQMKGKTVGMAYDRFGRAGTRVLGSPGGASLHAWRRQEGLPCQGAGR